MENIRNLLKQQEITSVLMTNREKGNIRDLYGEKVHLTSVDFLTDEDSTPYVVMIFEEDAERFYFGGSVITSRLAEVSGKFGSLDEFNTALMSDPVGIVFSMRTNKRGNKSYTIMEVV